MAVSIELLYVTWANACNDRQYAIVSCQYAIVSCQYAIVSCHEKIPIHNSIPAHQASCTYSFQVTRTIVMHTYI